MDEYIDRNALLQEIDQGRRTSKNSFPRQHFVVGDVLTYIRTAPAANVAKVRHGRWLDGKSLEKCSLCGKKGFSDWKYCPNCGARMGKEAEHETVQ